MTRLLSMFAIILMLAACGDNGGGDDTAVDQPQDQVTEDTAEVTPDTSEDVPEEEVPVTPRKTCLLACSAPEDCCITGQCGTYPDKWICDGHCALEGCSGDTECVDWATRRGFEDPDHYRCLARGDAGQRCVASCAIADDCCPDGADCSSYPNQYVCEDNACFIAGCSSDTECQTWAADSSLHRPDLYVCRPAPGEGRSICYQSCTAEADCCPTGHEPCDTLPYHFSCDEGLCQFTCTTDTECRNYASASGFPHAENYACVE